ncbi:MAG: hypothetical protein BWX88_05200 [Planctomycetes bacterium ADurb.Bin126]|nr:MAG: hypothetical protein BWX88_05200 [Planctomycetes bacterium ADurb.Bin126]
MSTTSQTVGVSSTSSSESGASIRLPVHSLPGLSPGARWALAATFTAPAILAVPPSVPASTLTGAEIKPSTSHVPAPVLTTRPEP